MLEDINTISINTTDYLQIENARRIDELIKLHDRVDDHDNEIEICVASRVKL